MDRVDAFIATLPTNQAELITYLKAIEEPHYVVFAIILTGLWMKYMFFQPRSKPSLDPQNWQFFHLVDKIVISPNTATYRFALQRGNYLGLPIGQHVSVSATIDGKLVQRSYTPTTSDKDIGFFELLIKSYPTGNISKYFSELKVGDKVSMKGPKGQMVYTPTLAKRIGMIAGGTGITPMLQIIRAALSNPKDTTQLSLIYANVNETDILLKAKLDKLALEHPEQFKVYYVLNNPPAGNWDGGVGFVSTEMIKEKLYPANDGTKILLCGPPPMITAMKKSLDVLKFEAPRTISKLDDQVFAF